MKFIYVLEDDERSQRDLLNTLKEIDSQLHIRFFNNLAEFHEWLKLAVQEGAKALAVGGHRHADDSLADVEPSLDHELRLVLAKNEFLGTKNMNLVGRAQEFFLRKKMCSAEEPTALILLAFDNPDFDIKLAEDRIVNNVIFKPYDKLILKLHLEYALTGRHPVKTETVASTQVTSKIEMLKDAHFENVSELGFTTLNNHEISVGAIRKYYADIFKTDEKKSVFAACRSCVEVSPKEFLCEFDFFGMDNKQIQLVRKHIQEDFHHEKNDLMNSYLRDMKVLVLNEESGNAENFKAYMNERFTGCEVFTYSSLGQLLSDLQDKETANRKTLPAKFDFVFATLGFFELEIEKRWEQIDKNLSDRAKKSSLDPSLKPVVYLFSKNKLSPDETLTFSSWARDIFFMPLDRAYFLKKVFNQNVHLGQVEGVTITKRKERGLLKVANPVEITEISEAGLIMKYPRSIGIGSFREFILWRPRELETPEIIGTVHYAEEDKGTPGTFLNHFVFFGMKDQYLKHIRLWLLDVYIQTKEKE